MIEIGDRVVRGAQCGAVMDTRQARTLMCEVRWDSGERQWLPAQELKPWDKSDAPPPAPVTPRGNTTPAYLLSLRKGLRKSPANKEKRLQGLAAEQLADRLVNLSDRKKSRTRSKAAAMIGDYERKRQAAAEWFASLPEETPPSKRTPEQWYELLPQLRPWAFKERKRA